MPLVATRGAASAQGFGEFAQATAVNYIEDVFSCFLYTGTGSSQTITNNIDLSTKGGLTWIKGRSGATSHRFTDTARGVTKSLESNSTAAEATESTGLTAFGTTGFTIGADADYNTNSETYASWTFRKQPKFFDVVTWTGTGSNTTIAHALGSVPGSIIVKRTDTTAAWAVYHRSLANTQYLVLNTTAAAATGATYWNSTTPTSTVFSLGTNASVNASGGTYVAYLFAHDAGGFGLTGSDNVISCGSFTTDGSGNATVSVGYEPQWVMYKGASGTGANSDWVIADIMRGYSLTGGKNLAANSSQTEGGLTGNPTATSFVVSDTINTTYIYIAIRRGPMKVPTLGTSVFDVDTLTPAANLTGTKVTNPFATDLLITTQRDHAGLPSTYAVDRLRGGSVSQRTNDASAEQSWGTPYSWTFDYNNGFLDNFAYPQGSVTTPMIYWSFKRAPGFFDEVCYTGTGSALNPTHSLGVTPELKIIKSRSGAVAWIVGGSVIGGGVNFYMFLETNAIVESTNYWSSGSDSATTFSTRAGNSTSNSSGQTYVAYLFATLAGVSKVFSYTGNGSSQTINCGFTGGARFVLIKRTDSTGDWYVWDSARGIVAGNDPHLSLNTTAAEVTTDDSVDTDNTGFIVNQVAATNVNVSSATYIGLAIA